MTFCIMDEDHTMGNALRYMLMKEYVQHRVPMILPFDPETQFRHGGLSIMEFFVYEGPCFAQVDTNTSVPASSFADTRTCCFSLTSGSLIRPRTRFTSVCKCRVRVAGQVATG